MDSYFTSKDIQLAEKCVNRWATPLSVRECELRPPARARSLSLGEHSPHTCKALSAILKGMRYFDTPSDDKKQKQLQYKMLAKVQRNWGIPIAGGNKGTQTLGEDACWFLVKLNTI